MSEDRELLVFAHLHKSAGTAVVNYGIAAGRTLPAAHANGNPVTAEGKPIGWFSKMGRSELRDHLAALRDEGADFVAMEWDFPRIEDFPRDMRLRFFTVLRDPLERLLSNMWMDTAMGYGPTPVGPLDYMNGVGIYRAPNYYVRYFCGCGPQDVLTDEHLDYAIEVVRQRFAYTLLERGDLRSFLEGVFGVGLPEAVDENRRVDRRKLRDWRGVAARPPSSGTIARLMEANALDYALMHVLRQAQREQVPT